jgi:glycosyltransferase involved in cell wall biosynthesis
VTDGADARSAGRPEPAVGTPTLSYVVPAHDSAAVLEATLQALGERLRDRGAEVVVVENGSTDGTPELLARLGRGWAHPGVALVALRSAKGMGNAYRAGIAASRGRRVLLTADDLPFGFDDLDAADRLPVEQAPVVIGSKGHRDSVVERGPSRAVLTWGFAVLRRLVLGMRTRDPQGTFVLDGDWARALAPMLVEDGYLVTTELCYLAERAGIQPVEVPVRLSADHGGHRSRVRLHDVWEMSVGLAGIRRRHAASPVPRPS